MYDSLPSRFGGGGRGGDRRGGGGYGGGRGGEVLFKSLKYEV